MHILENSIYKIEINDGVIKGIYDKRDGESANMADIKGASGSVSFTLDEDAIDAPKNYIELGPYKDRKSIGRVCNVSDNCMDLTDDEFGINTTYRIGNGIEIESSTNNPQISQFGINLELNFIEKDGDYHHQLLPTSPYTSDDERFQYCIMPRPDGRFLVVCAISEVAGWKIDYSSWACGHYLLNFKYLATFDKLYKKDLMIDKSIKIHMECADNIDEAYKIIHNVYSVPMCNIIVGGTFSDSPVVKVTDDTDRIVVIMPDGTEKEITKFNKDFCRIDVNTFGFCKVIPYSGDKRGMDAVVWYGKNMKQLFDNSTSSIKAPYHGDVNLCEGGCFLWDMLLNMRLSDRMDFDEIARSELRDIMGEDGVRIARRTIVPYKTDDYAPYHIADSSRVQEQFFGVSILLEAYKLYGEKKYLEFAVAAMDELCDNWITPEGMIYNGIDYTTVCAPVIAVADLAVVLKDMGDARYKRYSDAAVSVADFLIRRGISFPTEGGSGNSGFEDGSISCTALSVLYVCKNIKYDEKYIEFAKTIIDLHNAWTIYSSDVRMNQSSFRWWETIWEGDGEGPAICAGHAWTIWRAEALFLYGILAHDDEVLLNSWNSFMSNFVKTTEDGIMTSCYEPDYIRGGGIYGIKADMHTIKDSLLPSSFVLAHDYPKHTDNSLSRYAWVRNGYCWYNTAAVIKVNGDYVSLNAEIKDGKLIVSDIIENVYYGEGCEHFKCN